MALSNRLAAGLSTKVPPLLLPPLGSLLVSIRQRQPCLVRTDSSGGFAHRYQDGTVVQPRVGGPSARRQDQATREHFMFGYVPVTGDTVLDVGAGVGGEVRLFSRLVGASGRVVSIEAHPVTYRYLLRTVALNRLTNVTTVQCALTGSSGPVWLDNDLDNHISNGLTAQEHGSVLVPGRTLDEILATYDIELVDLLKMNIEGAELDVLRSARAALARVRNVAISCHDFKAGRPQAGASQSLRTFRPTVKLLAQAGFRIRTQDPDPARPWIGFYVYGSR